MRTNALVPSLLLSSFALTTLAAPAAAQTPQYLQIGQVAVAGKNHLGVLSPSGATSSTYSSPVSITDILWDPNLPDSFIASSGTIYNGGGQLIRITFTSATSVVTNPVASTGQFSRPTAMRWNQAGDAVVMLTISHQLHSVDVATGIATDITTGSQPWGNTSRSMAMSPTTGDIYVGTSTGDIYRLAAGNGNAVLVQSGLPASITELLVDGPNNQIVAVMPQAAGRIGLNFSNPPSYYFGTLGTPASPATFVGAAFDQNGDITLSASNNGLWTLDNLSSVPAGGLAPVQTGSITYPNIYSSSLGCTVVGGTNTPFRLKAEAVQPLGAQFAIENTPNGTGIGFLLMSTSTLLPVDTGPFFGLQPDLLTYILFSQTPTPGNIIAWAGGTDPQPLTIPALGMAPFFGQTWDIVGVAFDPSFQFLGRTNMRRVTWN